MQNVGVPIAAGNILIWKRRLCWTQAQNAGNLEEGGDACLRGSSVQFNVGLGLIMSLHYQSSKEAHCKVQYS